MSNVTLEDETEQGISGDEKDSQNSIENNTNEQQLQEKNMINNIEYANAYSEILGILRYIPLKDYNKIPKKKIKLF